MVKNLKNLTILIVIFSAILIGVTYFVYNKKTAGKDVLSPQEAAEKAISYINQNLLPEEVTASLIEVVEESDLYKFKLKV